jgi:hypothetical protein
VDRGVESSVIRAHQHAAGARHQPPKDIHAQRLVPMLAPDPHLGAARVALRTAAWDRRASAATYARWPVERLHARG